MAALMTILDFQNEYNVSRSTVYRLRERGELEFVHIGRAVRIRRDHADRWFDSLTGEVENEG